MEKREASLHADPAAKKRRLRNSRHAYDAVQSRRKGHRKGGKSKVPHIIKTRRRKEIGLVAYTFDGRHKKKSAQDSARLGRTGRITICGGGAKGKNLT